MKLYDISKEMNEILENGFTVNCIDEETGEIDESKVAEYLNSLQVEYADKVDNIACYIKDLKAQANAIGEEIKKLTDRKRSAEKKVEFLSNYLTDCMLSLGKIKFESVRNCISFRRSYSVDISNLEQIPKQFIKIKVSEDPDKKAIMAALKNDEEVEGATLKVNMNIQIK